jgi:uncharacterized alkaline shock family protein YloU
LTDTTGAGHVLTELEEDGVRGTVTIAPAVLVEIIEGATLPIDGVLKIVNPRRGARKSHAITGESGADDSGHWHSRRGIRVRIRENTVDAEVSVALRMNASIPDIAQGIQERVAQTVERMLGMQTGPIAVHVVQLQTERESA